MIYLDNAATTWPKPEPVYDAVTKAMRALGGNPGRSGHALSLAAGRAIEDTRLLLSRFFNASDPSRIVFARNATEAINLALQGTLKPGDHVITSSMEHNAVARTLQALKSRGVETTKVTTSPETGISLPEIEKSITPATRMIVVSHASNVTGTVQPVTQIGEIAHKHGLLFLVDTAQTAGILPIDVEGMDIDLLAFSAHKGLFGIQGVGGLYIGKAANPQPLIYGGTGSHSQSLDQPETFPDRYESGTPNTPGIVGLGAGIRFIIEQGVENIREREVSLAIRLLEGLHRMTNVIIYGPQTPGDRIGVVSLNVNGFDPIELSLMLSQSFDIATRAGLHCAPDAHATLGTLEKGTLRISVSYMNTIEDIDACLQALTVLTR